MNFLCKDTESYNGWNLNVKGGFILQRWTKHIDSLIYVNTGIAQLYTPASESKKNKKQKKKLPLL